MRTETGLPVRSASRSRNSPFYDWTLRGKAMLTVVGGEIVWRDAAFEGKLSESWRPESSSVPVEHI